MVIRTEKPVISWKFCNLIKRSYAWIQQRNFICVKKQWKKVSWMTNTQLHPIQSLKQYYKEVIWLASIHCSTTLPLHCSRQLTATGCTPVPATVPITLPFMKAHQTMKVSQFTAFKNMWVHKYSYIRLLLNIEKLGKISKPLYIILHFTRIRRNSSLIYKESPEVFDTRSFTHCKQSALRMHTMLPCAIIYYPVMDTPY
jgi:hypothetical protein